MSNRIKPIEMMDAVQIAIHVRCGDITMEQAKAVHHHNRIRAAERHIAEVDQMERERQERIEASSNMTQEQKEEEFKACVANLGI